MRKLIAVIALSGLVSVGLDKEIGSIEPGKRADLILQREIPIGDTCGRITSPADRTGDRGVRAGAAGGDADAAEYALEPRVHERAGADDSALCERA